MPFSILSQGVQADTLGGPSLRTVPFMDGILQVEAAPSVDASGGTLSIVSPGGVPQNRVLDIEYTAADGTTVQGTLDDIGIGGSVFEGAPMAFGNDLSSFIVIGVAREEIEFRFDVIVPDAYIVDVTDDGLVARPAFADSFAELSTSPFARVFPTLTPLGDGRVGYTLSLESGTVLESGLFVPIGEDVDDLGGGDVFIATDDGGVITVTQVSDTDEPLVYSIRQFNADYSLLESQEVSVDDLLAQSGLEIETPVVSIVVNDAGDLDVTLSDAADPLGDVFIIRFDLLEFDPDENAASDESEFLILTEGADVINLLEGTDRVYGLGGDDVITDNDRTGNNFRGGDRDVVFGGDGDDTVVLTAGRDLIYGGAGNDLIYGGDIGRNEVGERFGNTLYGGAGDDTALGGNLRDDLYGDAGRDTLFGRDGNDDLFGGTGDDEIYGGAENDLIEGGTGADMIYGGAGADAIEAGGTNSTVFGGGGNDMLFTDARFVTLFGGEGDDDLETFGDDNTLFGDQGDDVISTISVDSTTFGGDGDDTITLLGSRSTVFGGEGDDFIRMNSGRGSSAFGGDGSDSIVGSVNDDFIDGGAGDDWVTARYSVDRVLVEEGGLYGGFGDDTIYGRDGKDYLVGGEGDDDLRGGSGNDEDDQLGIGGGLKGGAGDDFMRGNHGDDDMFGSDGNDDMNGGFGDDLVTGGRGDDKIAGYNGNDLMRGGDGNDVISGGRGNDTLDGGAGDDILRGGDGNDRIFIGRGNDVLYGGDGRDTFSAGLSGLETEVTIKDFDVAQDKLFFALGGNGLSMDDIFLSREDSATVLQIEDVRIRLEKVEVNDVSELDIF